MFFSALGASTQSRSRLLRAKALAEAAVRDSGLETTIFAPSIIYAPGDRYLTLLSPAGADPRRDAVPGLRPRALRADLGRPTSPTA